MKAVNAGLEDYHKTPSGRVVVLKFPADGRERNIYLDQLGDVLSARVGVEGSTFMSRPVGPHVKKSAMKKSARKKLKSSSKLVTVVATRPWGGPDEFLFGKATAKIPKAILDFTILFAVHIRKIICPTRNHKVVLGNATSGAVGALAIWLMRKFGITDAVAEGYAAVILVTIVTATKGAFCDMTAGMAKAALKKA